MRQNRGDEEYRSTLGLHRAGSQRCHGSIQYYFYFYFLSIIRVAGEKIDCKDSITLGRAGAGKKGGGQGPEKGGESVILRSTQGIAALIA